MQVYSIDLSSGITESFFQNIHQLTDNSVIRKRLTEITIELLQNMKRHGIASTRQTLVIKKHRSHFFIESENQVRLEDVIALKNKIRLINSLDPAELKNQHTQILQIGTSSEKSGAGLGFYRIAMRAKTILNASFKPMAQNHFMFTLHINLAA